MVTKNFRRICEESASTINNLGERLHQIAIDQSFPHILVRDFAADACRKLDEKCVGNFSDEQILELSKVNSSIPTTGADEEPTGSYDFFEVDRKSERFHFDTMDTLRYWYAPWLRVFEGATTENFIKAAESWIVDEWGVIDEKPYGFREPRENRFSDRSFQLSSTSHGSLPTVERYRTHLEWHAKWCAAGQFLAERPLKKSPYSDGDEYSELGYKVSYGKLTKPPYWMADFVTNRPIELHHWTKGFEDASEWVENIDDDSFLRELFPETEPDWIVIDEYVDTQSDQWDVTSKVSTGLVSPNTAMSLVRALQTCPNDMDFYVCPEGHDLEINESEYKLKGWIRLNDGDRQFDEKDPFRIGISRPSHSPGSNVTKFFNLKEMMDDGLKWVNPATGLPVFRLEVWGDKGADIQNRYLGESVVSSGHRLLIEKGALSDFLQDQKMDIIADIEITRRDKSQGKKTFLRKQRGRQPTNEYYSSSDLEELTEPNKVLAIGERIVSELGVTDGVDTLGKWMAHHLASLIEEAKCSDDTQSKAKQEAVDLILKLWEHKSSLPGTADPMSQLKRAIEVIERLGPDSSPYFRQSRDKREQGLALLFDGLRQLVAHGVILISDRKEIPEYAADTFEHLSVEEQRFIVGLGGWVAFFEENKPRASYVNVIYADAEEDRDKVEEAAELEKLEPDERTKVQFSRSVDELIEHLHSFKKDVLEGPTTDD